jgi:hypothetical protein
MKFLGMSYKDLETTGFVEYQTAVLDVMDEEEKEIQLGSPLYSALLSEAPHEALIRAVAKMIEENNAVLLKQLKDLGVVQDTE